MTVIVPLGDAAKNEKESKLPEFPAAGLREAAAGLSAGAALVVGAVGSEPERPARDLRSVLAAAEGGHEVTATVQHDPRLDLVLDQLVAAAKTM